MDDAEADGARLMQSASHSFLDAIDMFATMAALREGNSQAIDEKLKEAGAGRAATLIQKALFMRLLITAMAHYPPSQDGDYSLNVGIELAKKGVGTIKTVAPRFDEGLLSAAIADWETCLKHSELKGLRTYRNKVVAHLSDYPEGVDRPIVEHLLACAERTSRVAEKLAAALDISRTGLDVQVDAYRQSVEAFWKPWQA